MSGRGIAVMSWVSYGTRSSTVVEVFHHSSFSAVLWCCWLGGRKSTRSVKKVMRCWRGYLSGARCKLFAYNPADATATRSSHAPVKSGMVYLSGAGLPQVVLEQRPLNRCSSISSSSIMSGEELVHLWHSLVLAECNICFNKKFSCHRQIIGRRYCSTDAHVEWHYDRSSEMPLSDKPFITPVVVLSNN